MISDRVPTGKRELGTEKLRVGKANGHKKMVYWVLVANSVVLTTELNTERRNKIPVSLFPFFRGKKTF